MQNDNTKLKISAIIIAKNAQDVIEDCLRSVSFCDEIIVVDGGSTDRTNDIAKRYHAKVISGTSNNFAQQRNIGLKHAKGDWVFYIDTDERVSKELTVAIENALGLPDFLPHPNPLLKGEGKQEVVAYKVQRKNFYFGNHEWPQLEHLERLFEKKSLKGWHGQLHESPIVTGSVGELSGYLLHYTHRDLSSMLTKTIAWSTIEAQLRFDHHHPKMTWWRFPRVMVTAFYDSYIRQKGYKAGTAGIVESMYQAFSIFVTYARLWEMQQEVKNKNAKIKTTN